MLYIKKIANKKYTIHGVGTSFAIFIDGIQTKRSFRSLKTAIKYIKLVAKEDLQVKIALKIGIPFIGIVCALLITYWR